MGRMLSFYQHKHFKSRPGPLILRLTRPCKGQAGYWFGILQDELLKFVFIKLDEETVKSLLKRSEELCQDMRFTPVIIKHLFLIVVFPCYNSTHSLLCFYFVCLAFTLFGIDHRQQ